MDNKVNDELLDYSSELKEIIEKKEGIFCKYLSQKEVGKKIVADLKNDEVYGEDDTTKEKGFYLFAGKRIGLVSQTQALQTLSLLIDNFEQNKDKWVLEKFYETTIDIVNRVYKPNGTIVFDASPYESESFNEEISYIDSITWTISTLLKVVAFSVKYEHVNFSPEILEKISKIISYGMNYINDSFISLDSEIWDSGWNFTKNCEVPSLYFTYAVSEYYVDIYETFYNVIKIEEIEKKIIELQNSDNYIQNIELIEQYKNERNELMKKNDTDEYYQLSNFFYKINNGKKSFEEGSLYYDLDKKVRKVAQKIWKYTRNDLANNFFSFDLKSKITDEMIRNSYSSDALFNTLFIINILVNGALDEFYQDKINEAGSSDNETEKKYWQNEYDNLFQTIKLAFEKTVRCYRLLKAEDKEYIVDQYILGFSESFVHHKDLIKLLRKKRIRGMSLVPLIVTSNNIISKYLIKYPQNEMIIYLEMILQNRSKNDDNKYRWRWDLEGYSALSTYYYVNAIQQFYNYYNTYEERFSAIETNNKKVKEDLYQKYLKELRSNDGEIGQLIREKNQLINENTNLKESISILKEKTSPLEEAVKVLFHTELQHYLMSTINIVLENVISHLNDKAISKKTNDKVSVIELNEDEELFVLNIKKLMLSMIAKYTIENIACTENDRSKENLSKKLVDSNTYISKDFSKVVNLYLTQVITSVSKKSDFNSTNGYEGLLKLLDTIKQ